MNIKFLLIGTSLSFIPLTVNAQCVETTNCETLGYTETSCNGGKGVKCPFGNKWACLGANEEECKQKFCDEYGFALTCTGTGYAGGAGSACGGKYTQCTCASGYEWKDGSCQKEMPTEEIVGDQYYCDGKIVGVRASGMDFFVAVRDAKNGSSGTMIWSNANAQAARAFCSKGRLPTLDELQLIYKNKSTINSLSTAARGQDLTNSWYWSSTVSGNNNPYLVDMSDGDTSWSYHNTTSYYVRPVLVDY